MRMLNRSPRLVSTGRLFSGIRRVVVVALATFLIAGDTFGAQIASRLAKAVSDQDRTVIRALVGQVDVNEPQPDGATALHWAAYRDDLESVELLLAAGATVSVRNDYGVTALQIACQNGNAAIIARLLDAGADPNAALPSGESALMTAARTGRVAAVKALMAGGAIIDATEQSKGQTALMWAFSERHLDVARALIDGGADFRLASNSGFSPLMFATREGDLEAVQLLVELGADVNATAVDGSSVLLLAVVRGHVPIAEYLLEVGADPNSADAGFTALHWAAGTWESIMTKDYLVESGEWSALGGVPKDRVALIRALIAHGADVNAVTSKSPPRYGFSLFNSGLVIGATPFYLAAMGADTEVMRLLLAAGADPTTVSGNETTPLMVAAGLAHVDGEGAITEAERIDAVSLLLMLGADLNAASSSGSTALQGATAVGFDRLVELLLVRGADVTAMNRMGQTALAIAEGGGQSPDRPGAAALLRKYGATR